MCHGAVCAARYSGMPPPPQQHRTATQQTSEGIPKANRTRPASPIGYGTSGFVEDELPTELLQPEPEAVANAPSLAAVDAALRAPNRSSDSDQPPDASGMLSGTAWRLGRFQKTGRLCLEVSTTTDFSKVGGYCEVLWHLEALSTGRST